MGKKASLKLDLSYDDGDYERDYERDNERDYERDYDCDEYDFVGKANLATKNNASTVAVSTPRRKLAYSFPTSFPGTQPSKLKVLASHMLSGTFRSPFAELTGLGHEDIVVRIARFLTIRSVAALSCSSKTMDRILSAQFLYCSVDGKLPCVSSLLIPANDAQPRLARQLAVNAGLFAKAVGPRERNLAMVPIVHSHSGGAITDCRLARSGRVLTYLTDTCELATLKSLSGTERTARKPRLKTAPSCTNVLASAISQDWCAVLSTASNGKRRYILSLMPCADAGKVWQKDIALTHSFATAMRPVTPSIKFDDDASYVAVRLKGRISIYSMAEQELHWEFPVSDTTCWKAWCFHRNYIVALCRNRAIKIFHIPARQMVASGNVPSAAFRQNDDQFGVAMEVFDDRIWIASKPRLTCTGRILQRVAGLTASKPTQSEHKKSRSSATGKPLQIKRFTEITTVSSHNPILRVCGKRIVVADGHVLKAFDSSVEGAGNADEQTPTRTVCTDAPIEAFDADSTKAVCCINSASKRRIEILRWDTAQSASLYESVLVRNAGAFCDRYDVDRLQLHGDRLLVAYSRRLNRKGEMRIFDLYTGTEDRSRLLK